MSNLSQFTISKQKLYDSAVADAEKQKIAQDRIKDLEKSYATFLENAINRALLKRH